MAFVDGMRGEDLMEGNLDNSSRAVNICDEAADNIREEQEEDEEEDDEEEVDDVSAVNKTAEPDAMEYSLKVSVDDALASEDRLMNFSFEASTPPQGRIPFRPINFSFESPRKVVSLCTRVFILVSNLHAILFIALSCLLCAAIITCEGATTTYRKCKLHPLIILSVFCHVYICKLCGSMTLYQLTFHVPFFIPERKCTTQHSLGASRDSSYSWDREG